MTMESWARQDKQLPLSLGFWDCLTLYADCIFKYDYDIYKFARDTHKLVQLHM